eukprot:2276669-Amphidinium_carterae.1
MNKNANTILWGFGGVLGGREGFRKLGGRFVSVSLISIIRLFAGRTIACGVFCNCSKMPFQVASLLPRGLHAEGHCT